jgi:hypothetical protein
MNPILELARKEEPEQITADNYKTLAAKYYGIYDYVVKMMTIVARYNKGVKGTGATCYSNFLKKNKYDRKTEPSEDEYDTAWQFLLGTYDKRPRKKYRIATNYSSYFQRILTNYFPKKPIKKDLVGEFKVLAETDDYDAYYYHEMMAIMVVTNEIECTQVKKSGSKSDGLTHSFGSRERRSTVKGKNLGKFRIYCCPTFRATLVTSDGNEAKQLIHPNINHGQMCYGMGHYQMLASLTEWRPIDTFDITLAILCTHWPGDRFYPMSSIKTDKKLEYCGDCGRLLENKNKVKCSICGTVSCNHCSPTCMQNTCKGKKAHYCKLNGCEKAHLLKDHKAYECAVCSRLHTPSPMYKALKCDTCGKDICRYCLWIHCTKCNIDLCTTCGQKKVHVCKKKKPARKK